VCERVVEAKHDLHHGPWHLTLVIFWLGMSLPLIRGCVVVTANMDFEHQRAIIVARRRRLMSGLPGLLKAYLPEPA